MFERYYYSLLSEEALVQCVFRACGTCGREIKCRVVSSDQRVYWAKLKEFELRP